MIELVVTVALTVIVLTAVSGSFVFASVRLSDAYTKSVLNDQMNGIADRMEATIRNAVTCSVSDGGSTLVCSMPVDGVDSDGDGYKDTYYPDSTDSGGDGVYSVGDQVWFYQADITGTYDSGSGYVWRAERASGGTAAAGDIDRSFAYYDNRILRYPLVNSVAFTVNATTQTVTFTITGSTRIGAETSAGVTDPSNGRTISLTRTIEWRN